MNVRAETIDFKPPRAGRWKGPVGLAVVVHVLLIAALTWGVSWKQDATPTFEAELWSLNAQQAAPRAVEPPPPPPRPPQPEPRPEPPTPSPPPPRPAPEPSKRAPDIATEQAKKKEQERKAAQEKAKEDEARKKKADEERKERERKLAEDRKKKQEAEQRRQEEKRKAEAQRKADDRRLAAAQKAARDEQMRRIQGLAGATGGPNATGTALRSSGPSSGYAGRVAAAIKPNIIYSEDFPSSLRTEVEVRARPDGKITDRRLVRSSGNRNWDDAALRAIDRTGSLPRDTDGRVPSPIVIVVRPTD